MHMNAKHIYTRQGDEGQTGLLHGQRVAKDDPRVETNGQLDELNALLGMVIALYHDEENDKRRLRQAQRAITQVMAVVAGASPQEQACPTEEDILQLEQAIDQAMGTRVFGFVLPGSNPLEALLHLARAKARTCERRLVTLSRQHPLPQTLLAYVNRLSDFLYALAVKNT